MKVSSDMKKKKKKNLLSCLLTKILIYGKNFLEIRKKNIYI